MATRQSFQLLPDGLNPEEQKRAKREADATSAAVTFSVVGEEYLAKSALEGGEAVTIAKSKWLLSLMTAVLDIGLLPTSRVLNLESLEKSRSQGSF